MILWKRKAFLYTGFTVFAVIFVMNKLTLSLHNYSTGPVQVLILTYMRSGSSLTGDILQHKPGSFYVFEPLRSFCPSNCSSVILKNLVYANGTERRTPISFNEESYSILRNWFSCKITQLPANGLLDVFLERGSKTKMFYPCYLKATLKTMDHSIAMEKCAGKLAEICEESSVRIIKTIRAQFKFVKHLLDVLPNLKIIHLVRDPRATLFSQSHFHMCLVANGGRQRCTNNLCGRLEKDVLEVDSVDISHPGRVMTIKYEDLAQRPIEMSQTMYDFIGVPMSPNTKRFIYYKTMAGIDNDCSICSTRRNSSAHIAFWKRQIDREFLDIINSRCDYILKRFQYDKFPK